MRCSPISSKSRWVPLRPCFRIFPEFALHVVEREIKLLGCHLRSHAEDAIMCDQSFESTTELMTLDPIHHVTTVRGSKSHGTLGVNVCQIILDVLKAPYKVLVRQSTPLTPNSVSEILSIAGGAGWVGCNDNEALLRKDGRVPASGPGILPSSLRATMDCE